MKEKCNIHNCHQGGCGHGHKSCVALVPIFNHLEKEQMEEIGAAIRPLSFCKGEVIYSQGDPSDSLYIVSKGRIRIYRLSESGKEQLLRILDPGDFTGELALFSESLHESCASAMTDVELCTVKRSDLQSLLLKYPSISLKLMAEFSRRLEQSERQTTSFATEKAETRLALFLLDCLLKGDGGKIVTLPMSKKDLASFLGTTPETISRKLLELEEEGLIRQISNKKIEIIDIDGLNLV